MRTLVIDDEENVRKGLMTFLSLRGIDAEGAGTYAEGLALARSGRFDAVLLDVRLGEEDGLLLQKEIQEAESDLAVIMISGHADIRTALEAVRSGAMDFLEKPVDQGRLETTLSSLSRRLELRKKLPGLEDAWLEEHVAGRGSAKMRDALSLARKAAASRLSILIRGSSGSGKELFARYIHMCSPRSSEPMVAVNCAAIAPELFESELFGHRKGAFTGADRDRDGFFQAASGGTLFLDEVGDLPLALQPKLLRALEYGEIQRVGSAAAENADVRVIAATNRNLEAKTASGAFREDLYFRLAQVSIAVPDLAERAEDIPSLAEHFMAKAAEGWSGAGEEESRKVLLPDAIAYLKAKPYRGNVRELRNLIERATFLVESKSISAGDLESLDQGTAFAPASPSARQDGAADGESAPGPSVQAIRAAAASMPLIGLKEARAEFDRRYISRVLEECGGSVSKAATVLGLLPNNLSREIRLLGLKRRS
jgi:DNA-binding NtrC family response regulator